MIRQTASEAEAWIVSNQSFCEKVRRLKISSGRTESGWGLSKKRPARSCRRYTWPLYLMMLSGFEARHHAGGRLAQLRSARSLPPECNCGAHARAGVGTLAGSRRQMQNALEPTRRCRQ